MVNYKSVLIIVIISLSVSCFFCDDNELYLAVLNDRLPSQNITNVQVDTINKVSINLQYEVNVDDAVNAENYVITYLNDASERVILEVIASYWDEEDPSAISLETEFLDDNTDYSLTIYNVSSDYTRKLPESGISYDFKTADLEDNIPPTLLSYTVRSDEDYTVSYNQVWTNITDGMIYPITGVELVFDEPMDSVTVRAAITFEVNGTEQEIPEGEWSDYKQKVFYEFADIKVRSLCRLVVSADAKDSRANPLTNPIEEVIFYHGAPEGVDDNEPDDNFGEATLIELDTIYTGNIHEEDDEDFYIIELSKDSVYIVSLDNLPEDTDYDMMFYYAADNSSYFKDPVPMDSSGKKYMIFPPISGTNDYYIKVYSKTGSSSQNYMIIVYEYVMEYGIYFDTTRISETNQSTVELVITGGNSTDTYDFDVVSRDDEGNLTGTAHYVGSVGDGNIMINVTTFPDGLLYIINFVLETQEGARGDIIKGLNTALKDTGLPYVVSISPESSLSINRNSQIVVVFSELMETLSLSLSGTLISGDYEIQWSKTSFENDTLTIYTNSSWEYGRQTLAIDCEDRVGHGIDTENIVYGIQTLFVGPGELTGTGQLDDPVENINDAISYASNYLDSEEWDGIAEVHVATGTYTVDSSSYIELHDNVSIKGGYSSDWSERNPASYITTIDDTETANQSTFEYSNRAIYGEGEISSDTVVSGFVITGGSGYYACGILLKDLANPTITDNDINGGEAISHATGILLLGSSPVITNNIIHSGGSSCHYTYGIRVLYNSSPVILGNTSIEAANGNTYSYGIIISYCSDVSISGNELIKSGNAGDNSYGIFMFQSNNIAIIGNATIQSGYANSYSVGIEVQGSDNVDISENTLIKSDYGMSSSIGIYITYYGTDGSDNVYISHNTDIEGGSGSYSRGISTHLGNGNISNNGCIDCGTADINCYALRIVNESDFTIQGNTIHNETASSSATLAGIFIASESTAEIIGNTINGGSSTTDTLGISVNLDTGSELTTPVTITGNNIYGGTSSYMNSYGIYFENSTGTSSVSGNTIQAGTADTDSWGIAMEESENITISDNDVNGGASDNSSGMCLINSSNISVLDSTISGGSGSTSTFGIITQVPSSIEISNNSINAGTGSGIACGVFIYAAFSPNINTFKNNIIHGGTSNGENNGIFILDSDGNTKIYNNAIYGGEGGLEATGISLENSYAEIVHNSINSGTGTSNYYSFNSTNSEPDIYNNNIYTTGSGYIFWLSDTVFPNEIAYNSIFNFSIVCRNDGGIPIEIVSGINILTHAHDNLEGENLYDDLDSADDFRYRFIGDLSGYNFHIWIPSVYSGLEQDLEGTTRTAPCSTGAIEYNEE